MKKRLIGYVAALTGSIHAGRVRSAGSRHGRWAADPVPRQVHPRQVNPSQVHPRQTLPRQAHPRQVHPRQMPPKVQVQRALPSPSGIPWAE